MNTQSAVAPVGHNNPPSDEEIILTQIREGSKAELKRLDELVAAAGRLPKKIENEEDAAKVTSFGAQIKRCMQTLEERRKVEKAPFDAKASTVQNFFKTQQSALDAILLKTTDIVLAYKRDEERKIREQAEIDRKAAAEQAEKDRAAALLLAEKAAEQADVGFTKKSEETLQQAQTLESQANHMAREAAAPVEQVRSVIRGSGGGSTVTRYTIEGDVADVDKIDWTILGPHFNRPEIDKAVSRLAASYQKKLKATDDLPIIAGITLKRSESLSFKK